MGYYLQAFICKQTDSSALTSYFDKAKSVSIGQGMILIPMTEDFFDQINNSVVSGSIANFEYLTENMENEILKCIGDKKIAYVEAEYFGGEGGQSAICWENKKRQYILPYGHEKINQVLKDFGVKIKLGKDEFETLGLNRHRHTREW
jgi:hypothetical protein